MSTIIFINIAAHVLVYLALTVGLSFAGRRLNHSFSIWNDQQESRLQKVLAGGSNDDLH